MDTGGGGQVSGAGLGDLLTSCWQLRCGLRQAGLRWGLRPGVALPGLDPAERGGNTCHQSLDIEPASSRDRCDARTGGAAPPPRPSPASAPLVTSPAPTWAASPPRLPVNITQKILHKPQKIFIPVNGVPCVCTGGHCAAKDGTDVCAMFGHPCGAPPPAPPTTTSPPSYVSPVSCSRPCNLQSALDAVRGQVSATVITVNGKYLLLLKIIFSMFQIFPF